MSKTTRPSAEGKTAAKGKTPCPKHPDKHITLACTPCKILICESCKPNHADHDVKPCTTDGKLVQNICRAQTQSYIDIIVELENLKDEQDVGTDVYKEAKTEVNDKIQQIIKDATELQKRINDKLDEASENRKKKQDVVCEKIKTVDDRIGHLNNIRNVKDLEVLIPEAVNNAVMLEEFAKSNRNTPSVVPVIDTVLPNIEKFHTVLDTMKDVFKLDTSADKEVEYDYTSVTPLGHVNIPDGFNNAYIICDSGISDKADAEEVILGGIYKTDWRTYNIRSNKIDRKHSNIVLHTHLVKVSSDKYAAVDNAKNLHLIDNKGVILHTEKQTLSDYQYLCFHSPGKMVKLNRNNINVTLSRIGISSNKFFTETEITFVTDDKPWFIASHKDNNTVTMVSDTRLYKVNMATSAVDTRDISSCNFLGSVCSIYVDRNDNVLVGDGEGKIHVFGKNMEHDIIAEVDDPVFGITIRNDELIAIAKAKICRFKLSTK